MSLQNAVYVSLLAVLSLPIVALAQSDTTKRSKGKDVIVTGFPVEEGLTPVPSAELTKSEIEPQLTVQDPPKLVSYTPSATFYSMSGTDVGYSFLSLRGFDQRRLSILVNGVPQNDPEDHQVYWIDMPDLAGYAESIQVQRGAGNAFYGPPAIGGSVNLVTEMPSIQGVRLSAGYGSYNTKKFAVEASSGLVFENWLFHARLSQTTTDGYRNKSWVDLKSYYLSIKRVSEDHTLQANFFGGPIEDGLNYYGIYDSLTHPEARKKNWSESFAYERRDQEQERFFQPHYEVLSQYQLSSNVTLNNTVFYVQGDGEFDFDGTWVQPFTGYKHSDYYRVSKPYAEAYGFTAVTDTTLGDELVRAFVGNKQWGWIPRLTIDLPKLTITTGAELRMHNSVHWGKLLSALRMPSDLPADYHFYEYEGAKDIIAPYLALQYQAHEDLHLFGSVQYISQRYQIHNEKPFFLDTATAVNLGIQPGWQSREFGVDFDFVNPRVGLRLNISTNASLFASVSRTSREPRLKDYYNAEFFSEPNFERRADGQYDFNKPKIKPETLTDVEAGVHVGHLALSDEVTLGANINAYYMMFEDELVKTGATDRFGSSIMTNAEQTNHSGLELGVQAGFRDILSLEVVGSLSKHEIAKFDPVKMPDSLSIVGNRPIGFPELTMAANLRWNPIKQLMVLWQTRLQGEYYSDLKNSVEAKNPEFSVTDLTLAYTHTFDEQYSVTVKGQVLNLFDRLYTSYAEGGLWFVAAPRHFYGSVEFGF